MHCVERPRLMLYTGLVTMSRPVDVFPSVSYSYHGAFMYYIVRAFITIKHNYYPVRGLIVLYGSSHCIKLDAHGVRTMTSQVNEPPEDSNLLPTHLYRHTAVALSKKRINWKLYLPVFPGCQISFYLRHLISAPIRVIGHGPVACAL